VPPRLRPVNILGAEDFLLRKSTAAIRSAMLEEKLVAAKPPPLLPSPVKSKTQHADTLRRKLTAHMERLEAVFRARKAVSEQCIGSRGGHRAIQARCKLKAARAGKADELIARHGAAMRGGSGQISVMTTSTLPRIALEYGHVWCAASTNV
jgi:hypothetical protein